jgi:MFS family permease
MFLLACAMGSARMRNGPMTARDIAPDTMRRRDFRLFWLAGAVNEFGSQASGLALPILVLAVGGSALTAGVLGTAAAVADLVLTPFAGVVADRHSRRSMLVVSALVAGCAMGAVAAGVATHTASLILLFCAAVVEGMATACYAAAAAGAIRSVLPMDEPERALGALQSREQAARLVGPGLGGGLFSLAAWAPFLVDAVSYVIASVCVGSIRAGLRPDRESGPAPTFGRDLREGLRFVRQRPFLRFVAVWAGGVNLVFGALSLEVILVARLRGDSAASIGAVLTMAGVAGLIGALLAPRVLSRVRAGARRP